MRLRASAAGDKSKRQQASYTRRHGLLFFLATIVAFWFALVYFLFPEARQSQRDSYSSGHVRKVADVSTKKPWYTRHLLLRDALLRRDAKRVYVLHLGDARRFAELAEANGELVTLTDGCGDDSLATDLLGTSARDQCRALRGHPHSLVINAYGLPAEPYLEERALYVAFLPQPGSFAPARCPSTDRASRWPWLPLWAARGRTSPAGFFQALAGGTGQGAEAAAAKSKAVLGLFDAVFTADEWVPDSASLLVRLLGWDPERLPQAGWTAADVGLIPPGRAAARAPQATAAERGVYERACGMAREGMMKAAAGAPYLREWLNFHRAAGVARVYLHNDNSTDNTNEVLAPYESAGFVVRLEGLYGPLRFRVNERTAAGGWSGQREVLGRCMTHAVLDSACWLLNPDLDEYFVPAKPSPEKTLGGVLAPYQGLMCATVRRHAFNSNNASATHPGATGITRVFLRRYAPFPPEIMELPRNPKWALNVPLAARELAAGGRHAVVPQIHNLWDRRNCSMCFRGDPEFTPEIHPCAAFYADDRYKGPGPENPRNWCTGATGASVEEALKVHHYILPDGKSYRKKGRGDKGARRDIWDNETVDADALVFAPAVDAFGPP